MKKSSSYRETFRRHLDPLSVPIIVATLIAGWLAVGAPQSYKSTTNLWVSNAAYSANPAEVGSDMPSGQRADSSLGSSPSDTPVRPDRWP